VEGEFKMNKFCTILVAANNELEITNSDRKTWTPLRKKLLVTMTEEANTNSNTVI